MSGEGSTTSMQVSHIPGLYGFTIHPGLEGHDRQMRGENPDFMFSKNLGCLYVKREAQCPFGISTSGVPPQNSKIKIIVYTEDEVAVMRCANHTPEKIEEFVSPFHFMRSGNGSARYDCCEDTGELSISLPYIQPQGGVENVENLEFMCSTKNCVKKKTFLKFSLVNSGEVLGYIVFRLHVCSSPARDLENHIALRSGKKRRKTKEASDGSAETVPRDAGAVAIPSDNDENTYVIKVEKRWIRDYLVSINRGLELLEAMPYEDQEEYLRRHRANLASSGQTSSTCTSTSSRNSSDTRYTLRRILVRS